MTAEAPGAMLATTSAKSRSSLSVATMPRSTERLWTTCTLTPTPVPTTSPSNVDTHPRFAILRHIALNLIKQEQLLEPGIKCKRLNVGWDHPDLLTILILSWFAMALASHFAKFTVDSTQTRTVHTCIVTLVIAIGCWLLVTVSPHPSERISNC